MELIDAKEADGEEVEEVEESVGDETFVEGVLAGEMLSTPLVIWSSVVL